MASQFRQSRKRFVALLLAAAFGIALLVPPHAGRAAVQGSQGTTSTGSVQIFLSLGVSIIIRGLDDIDLGIWPGTGNLAGQSNHCVGTNVPGGLFRIRATGSGVGGAFQLTSGPSTLAYDVYYDDGGGLVQMTQGSFLTGRQGVSGFAAFLCFLFGGTAEVVQVRIPAANLAAVPAGTYTGTLTLTVGPE